MDASPLELGKIGQRRLCLSGVSPTTRWVGFIPGGLPPPSSVPMSLPASSVRNSDNAGGSRCLRPHQKTITARKTIVALIFLKDGALLCCPWQNRGGYKPGGWSDLTHQLVLRPGGPFSRRLEQVGVPGHFSLSAWFLHTISPAW